jgi:hypothetical protein
MYECIFSLITLEEAYFHETDRCKEFQHGGLANFEARAIEACSIATL